ncbi:MAG: hypothetical protein ACRDOU_07330 [Streptosporangiaceae bacterium]
MRKALIAIAIAIITTAVLAACGSSPSTTQASDTTAAAATAPASQAAVTTAPASQTATTAAATQAPATTAPATTGAATQAAATTAATAIAVTVPAWCINPRPVTPPGTLAEWLSAGGGYGYAQYVQDDLVKLLGPFSTAATEVAVNRGFCQAIGFAKYAPPPVDVAGYTVALDDSIRASMVVDNGPNTVNQGEGEAPALAAARPYLEAAETAFKAFLAAVGHPVA